eukprot:Phypoly_transcript_18241.p1 GENE.Phypoly_transcript_18241~~Phypoly_transcript_18241.p1  ORF type:complete len:202 (+),score=10.39 Phypoly_transcript_18241:15-620(+)
MDAISLLASKFTRKKQSREEWLNEQILNYRFVVLLFYRGKWDVSMWDYLTAFVACVPHLRAGGGELVVVVPKSKSEKKKMEKHFNSSFKVIHDPEHHLANKFKISVRKPESKFSVLLHSASTPISKSDKRHSIACYPEQSTDVFHYAHPGVLVISGTNKEGEWTTKRTIKNSYELNEHFTPVGLRDLLDLHFGRVRKNVAP